MQAAIRQSEWDECAVHYGHGPSPVTYVYRRGPPSQQWEAWVVVAESAILRRLGRRGMGLYAGRAFTEGQYLGKYEGALVGHYDTRRDALTAPETRRLLRRGHDKLVAVRAAHGPGFDLLDGESAGPPYLQMANDPRGTRLQPNVELTEAGWMRVLRGRVPAFSVDRSLEENINSELRWDYGDDYWDLHTLLGTDTTHAIEVD